MADLGKVKVKVIFREVLPNIKSNTKPNSVRQHFDFNALESGHMVLNNSDYPATHTSLSVDSGKCFAALHPSAEFYQIDNYLEKSSTTTSQYPYVVWKQEDCKKDKVFGAATYLMNMIGPDYADQDFNASFNYPANYKGPIWETSYSRRENQTVYSSSNSDSNSANTKSTGNPANTKSNTKSTGDSANTKSTGDSANTKSTGDSANKQSTSNNQTVQNEDYYRVIHQKNSEKGIWWGVSATLEKQPNIGFWIDINRLEARSAKNQPGFIAIRINPDHATTPSASTACCFDLVFENNKTPSLYDWAIANPDASKSGEPWSQQLPIGGLTETSGRLRVGFLPIMGRLKIIINGADFIYWRSLKNEEKKDKKTSEDKSSSKPANQETPSSTSFRRQLFTFDCQKISVFGSNCAATVQMAAMVFNKAEMGLPIYGALDEEGKPNQEWGDVQNTSPVQASNRSGWGVSSSNIKIDDDPVLKEINYVGYGSILLSLVTSKSNKNCKFMKAVLTPDLKKFNNTVDLPIGCPFIFRLKGTKAAVVADNTNSSQRNAGNGSIPQQEKVFNLSNYVISLSENWGSSNRNNVDHSVDLVVYNPNGMFDTLRTRSWAVSISIGWRKDEEQRFAAEKIFTGVSYNSFPSYVAGKETISFHCEDYMSILENTPIINSPYYDGVDSFKAIEDLAARAGVSTINNATFGGMTYYLPAGYSWTQPRMKFPSGTTLKSAMIEICKLCESVVYFDENGVLHFSRLQGGIFGEPSGSVTNFYRHPALDEEKNQDDEKKNQIILDEEKIEYKLSSAVNCIQIKTIDRTDEGGVIFAERSGGVNTFPFLKPFIQETPVLASMEATVYYIEMLKARLFKVPRTISFKTLKSGGLKPMDMFTVYEGLDIKTRMIFRCMNISRSYDANSNSMDLNISGEYYGT